MVLIPYYFHSIGNIPHFEVSTVVVVPLAVRSPWVPSLGWW